MRLFVSLSLPPIARAHLVAALPAVRTTRVDQWHVTLAFLGEVDDPAPLQPALDAVASVARPLHLRLRGREPLSSDVLAAGVAGDVEGLRALAADVRRACRESGIVLERRRYSPHVTVARRPVDASVLDGYEGPSWTATELELVRSVLAARAEHVLITRHLLGG